MFIQCCARIFKLAAHSLTYTRLNLSCLSAAALQAYLILSCQSVLHFLSSSDSTRCLASRRKATNRVVYSACVCMYNTYIIHTLIAGCGFIPDSQIACCIPRSSKTTIYCLLHAMHKYTFLNWQVSAMDHTLNR